MLSILTVTLPIYILILAGYCAARWGWFPRDNFKTLGLFVIRFALPFMLFKTLSQSSADEVLNGRFVAAYAIGSVLSFAWGWFSQPQHAKEFRALRGIGMSCSNTGFIGAPIVLQWLGPSVGVTFALAMIVENLCVLPLMLILAERDDKSTSNPLVFAQQIFKPLLKNPLIIAIVLGFMCSVLDFKLPTPLVRVVDMFAGASGALSLFVIGGTLFGLKINDLLPIASKISIGKLLIHPLCVGIFMLILLPHQPVLCAAAIALAAMPMMGIYPIIGQKYGHEGFCAATLLVTTVASFFSLLALMSLLNHFLLG